MNEVARAKLVLKEGEVLEHVSHRMKGTLQEEDIDTYDILNASGEKVGSVTHTDHTAIRGFTRTQTIEQYNSEGKLVVDTRWSGR